MVDVEIIHLFTMLVFISVTIAVKRRRIKYCDSWKMKLRRKKGGKEIMKTEYLTKERLKKFPLCYKIKLLRVNWLPAHQCAQRSILWGSQNQTKSRHCILALVVTMRCKARAIPSPTKRKSLKISQQEAVSQVAVISVRQISFCVHFLLFLPNRLKVQQTASICGFPECACRWNNHFRRLRYGLSDLQHHHRFSPDT